MEDNCSNVARSKILDERGKKKVTFNYKLKDQPELNYK